MNDSTCRRGNTSVWPGFAGRMSRNATTRSLSRTGLDWSSPSRIRQKTHGSIHHHSGERPSRSRKRWCRLIEPGSTTSKTARILPHRRLAAENARFSLMEMPQRVNCRSRRTPAFYTSRLLERTGMRHIARTMRERSRSASRLDLGCRRRFGAASRIFGCSTGSRAEMLERSRQLARGLNLGIDDDN